MSSQQFNARRLSELEELLEIDYGTYHEFEREIALANGNEKIALKVRFKSEIVPHLVQLEKEYTELLVRKVPTDRIPKNEAAAIVAELSEATNNVLLSASPDAPRNMIGLLEEIKEKLSQPKEPASAKLKFSLPLIPTILSYEVEMDTIHPLRGIWERARDGLKALVESDPR